MELLLGRDRVRKSQIVKQADVVMLLHMLWDDVPDAVQTVNYGYYEPRTTHGSSLSPAIHAVVAARLGELAIAQKYFRQTAEIDLANNMGNAAGGVHAAALGGLWQAAVFGFGGMRPRDDHLSFAPQLPVAWTSLRFRIVWRDSVLDILVHPDELEVSMVEPTGAAVLVEVGDNGPIPISAGARYLARRVGRQWTPLGIVAA